MASAVFTCMLCIFRVFTVKTKLLLWHITNLKNVILKNTVCGRVISLLKYHLQIKLTELSNGENSHVTIVTFVVVA